MKYNVVYDQPGRLRLRCGPYAFTEQQGYYLAGLLKTCQAVKSVTVTYRNGGILLLYDSDHRQQILDIVTAIRKNDLLDGEATEEDISSKLDNDFQMSLVKVTGCHMARKIFLPPILRNCWTVVRAIGYIARGLKFLWQGKLNVDVLDAASISAALVQKSCNTAGSIMFLLKVSSLLEDYTCQRTHNALARSLLINVEKVWRVDDGAETLVPMADIRINDIIKIHAGNMIPVDGIVMEGEAMVNEASMTGEPLPVAKPQSSSVYAGTSLKKEPFLLA